MLGDPITLAKWPLHEAAPLHKEKDLKQSPSQGSHILITGERQSCPQCSACWGKQAQCSLILEKGVRTFLWQVQAEFTPYQGMWRYSGWEWNPAHCGFVPGTKASCFCWKRPLSNYYWLAHSPKNCFMWSELIWPIIEMYLNTSAVSRKTNFKQRGILHQHS